MTSIEVNLSICESLMNWIRKKLYLEVNKKKIKYIEKEDFFIYVCHFMNSFMCVVWWSITWF